MDKTQGVLSERSATMRKAIVKQWTEALRSGKFTQTEGKLYNPAIDGGRGGYCCLGVLLEVASPFDWDKDQRAWVSDDEEVIEQCNQWYYEMEYEEPEPMEKVVICDEEFPSWLLDWFGMEVSEQSTFIHLNDTAGAQFHEIADEIEAIYY